MPEITVERGQFGTQLPLTLVEDLRRRADALRVTQSVLVEVCLRAMLAKVSDETLIKLCVSRSARKHVRRSAVPPEVTP